MRLWVGLFLLVALVAASSAAAHPTTALTGKVAEQWQRRAVLAQRPLQLPVARRAEPALAATPQGVCGPGSRPEPGMQGRVPGDAIRSGAAKDGYTCNTTPVGHQGSSGGFKVLRYVDNAGRECAYYDTTLLFPLNLTNLSSEPTAGVAALDMSNPAKPVKTASLLTPAMLTPHESLVLNAKRGLLAAVMGNPAFYPGIVDIYDVSQDCRRPVLQSSLPVALLGHESGFAPDGRTFYAANPGGGPITAVDVSNPKAPVPLWLGQYNSHGLSISDDGNRAYVADIGNGLLILDVSEIQARKPNPQVREVSRLRWESMTIPQNAIPVTIGGKPYLVEIDEYSGGGSMFNGPTVGAARIIDISDERAPRVVSNLRLAVHQPENRAQLAGDPGALSPVQGYAGHYCNVPQRDEPGIVACSMIASGLRVFDVRDPLAPKEIAYFVAPPQPSPVVQEPSNFAMSSPSFVPERGEIWYSDGNSGFYAVKVAEGVWPFRADAPASCSETSGLKTVSATRAGRSGVWLSFGRRVKQPVRVDVFRVSSGRRVVRERLVARFDGRDRSFVWNGAANRGGHRGAVGRGYYFARFSMLRGGKLVDTARIALRRDSGGFTRRPDHYRRESCGLLSSFKLERPVFGGERGEALRASYRLSSAAPVTITVSRGGKVVRRFPAAERRAGRTYRVELLAKGLSLGDYQVRLQVGGVSATLTSHRL